MISWLDVGVAWKVELATTGDLLLPSIRTDLSYVAGGPNGVPQGWLSLLQGAGAAWADVNTTVNTSNNTWSISNALGSVFSARSYGAYRDIPAIVGHRYQVAFDVRTMAGKSQGAFNLQLWAINAAGAQFATLGGTNINTQADYETNLYQTTSAMPAGTVSLRIEFNYRSAVTGTPPVDWGVQTTNVFVIDRDPTPASITWFDMTCDVMSIETHYGREQFTNRYDVATATVTVSNEEGTYSYRNPHPLNLRPGRQIRGTVTYLGVTYPMFYMVVDSLEDAYSMDGHAITTISCVDPTTVMSNMPTPTLPAPFAGYTSGQRILSILDSVGYVARSAMGGQFIQQRITANGRTLRDEAGVTADSEGGNLFADREGRITYKDRTWVSVDPQLNTVQAQLLARPHDADIMPIVDGVPTVALAPLVCTNALEVEWNRERLINSVELANSGGTAERFEDGASRLAYGTYTYQRNDFVNDITASNAGNYLSLRAHDLMDGYAAPVQRVNRVSYRPMANRDVGEIWWFTLNVFLNWLVRVWYAHPTNLWGYAVVTHVQSINHSITTKDWTVELAVDAPVSFVNAPIVPLYVWDDTSITWDDGATTWG